MTLDGPGSRVLAIAAVQHITILMCDCIAIIHYSLLHWELQLQLELAQSESPPAGIDREELCYRSSARAAQSNSTQHTPTATAHANSISRDEGAPTRASAVDRYTRGFSIARRTRRPVLSTAQVALRLARTRDWAGHARPAIRAIGPTAVAWVRPS